MSLFADPVPPPSCGERKDAQPNLVRISTPEEHVSDAPISRRTTYKFDTGSGINQNIYVIDTGVRDDHSDLPGVEWIGNFVTTQKIDDNGHGNIII